MIWLTWRQFRASALALFAVLGAVVAVLAYTGPGLYRDYEDLMARCGRTCPDAFDHFFFPRLGAYTGLMLLVIAVPAVVGVFWGAPLIGREYETGTQDLVWQQSISRHRWLAVKVGLVGLAAIAAAGLIVTAVSWWSRPLDATAIDPLVRLSPFVFDARGYVVLGHTAFAFTLGAAAGLLIRRTVPAMAVTLVVFIAAQILMPMAVRPHLATPVRLETTIAASNLNGYEPNGTSGGLLGIQVSIGKPGAWILSNVTVDSAGHEIDTLPAWTADCATPDDPSGDLRQDRCLARLAAEGYRQVVTYHPAERFWRFQAYETAIFGVLSLLLLGFCFRRIRPT